MENVYWYIKYPGVKQRCALDFLIVQPLEQAWAKLIVLKTSPIYFVPVL